MLSLCRDCQRDPFLAREVLGSQRFLALDDITTLLDALEEVPPDLFTSFFSNLLETVTTLTLKWSWLSGDPRPKVVAPRT